MRPRPRPIDRPARRAPPRRAGFGLLEALVALVVVAVGVTAAQRLASRSVAAVAHDVAVTGALFDARALLADAALAPPEPGTTHGTTPGGRTYARTVTRTAHPALREVRIRVEAAGAGALPVELVEVIRVPPA